MPKRVFKGNINPETFEKDLVEFSQQFNEDYIKTEEQRKIYVGQVLSYYDEGYGLIDWREVCIFTDGYLMQTPETVENFKSKN
jgi:hypothetical protein